MRHRSAQKSRPLSRKARTLRQITCGITTTSFIVLESHAQIATDGTMGAAQTLKGPNYTIGAELGTQRGANLFHSFQEFGLKTGESALFTGPTGLQNVIGRVTGGNLSSIDGLLRSEVPQANVWLINPAGVLFGPHAAIDVPAAFHVSAADHLRFGDGALFSAQHPAKSTLTTAPIAAFGFLNAAPAKLTVTGSHLAVKEGQTFSLIGGGIDVHNGILQAPAGRINVVAVGSAGDFSLTEQGIGLDGFTGMGDIRIVRDTGIERVTINEIGLGDVNTSGQGGGVIYIRGGNMVMDNGAIYADTYGNQTGVGIDIELLGNLEMVRGSRVTADAVSGRGSGGNVYLTIAELLDIRNGAEVSADTWGTGDAGSVTIRAKNVMVDGQGFEQFTGIDSSAEPNSAGSAGGIKITITELLDIRNGGEVSADAWGTGDAGSVTIRAKNVVVDGQGFKQFTGIDSSAEPNSTGSAGGINLTIAELLDIRNGGEVSADTWGTGDAGSVTIRAKNVVVDGQALEQFTGIDSSAEPNSTGSAGGINLTITELLDIRNGGEVSASTWGEGNAGSLTVNTGDIIYITNGSYIYVASYETGQAGDVIVTAPHLTIENNSFIAGNSEKTTGGNLTINANHIKLFEKSGITTSVFGDDQTIGGNITINGSNIVALNGSKIITQATQGFGGKIFINADALLYDTKNESDVISASSGVAGRDGIVDNKAVKVSASDLGMSSNTLNNAGFSKALLCKKTRVPKNKRSRIVKVGRGALPADNKLEITVSLAQNQPSGAAPTTGSSSAAPLQLSYTDCLPAPGEQGDGIAADVAKAQKPVGKRTGKRVAHGKKR